ncbi:MAG: hypothetical protein MJZ57_03595 [Bacteroidales bacterium]|nr:hypothetical protein [Bacteroidales bacterium]
MYKGKATCKILKEIRKQIAKENDIAFATSECKYQGDCLGTCPACEAEVRYLEKELCKRKQLRKAAILTCAPLGLATSFLGCHFGGAMEEITTETTSPEPEKQENIASSMYTAETERAGQKVQKQSRSDKHFKTEDDNLELDFGGIEDESIPKNTQPLSSDTIDIIYEMPEFEPDGTIRATSITTPNNPSKVCLHPSKEPVFPGGEEACRQFIQQHVQISPKLEQYLRGKDIFFTFFIEKNGKISKVDAACFNVQKAQKRWSKRCERAVKKSIKAMPRWTPGRDQDNEPVRCVKNGHISVGKPIQVWLDN